MSDAYYCRECTLQEKDVSVHWGQIAVICMFLCVNGNDFILHIASFIAGICFAVNGNHSVAVFAGDKVTVLV